MPALLQRGTASGIDARLVVDTGVAPIINRGSPTARPASGRWGRLVRAPMACFEQLRQAAEKHTGSGGCWLIAFALYGYYIRSCLKPYVVSPDYQSQANS